MNTILLIEDNQSYRESLDELFQMDGYMTIAASNGLRGLQMIKEHLPNLIICDIDMPGMTGLEVLRSVKADPVLATIPFLILSANSDSNMRAEIYDLGVHAMLSKSILIDELRTVIAHLLTQNAPLL